MKCRSKVLKYLRVNFGLVFILACIVVLLAGVLEEAASVHLFSVLFFLSFYSMIWLLPTGLIGMGISIYTSSSISDRVVKFSYLLISVPLSLTFTTVITFFLAGPVSVMI